MSTTLLVIVFILLFELVLVLVGIGLKLLDADRKRRFAGTLKSPAGNLAGHRPLVDTLLPEKLELSRLPLLAQMQQTIHQAGLEWSSWNLLAVMTVTAMAGALLGSRIRVPVFQEFFTAAAAALFFALPYLFVAAKRSRRMRELEEQLPEAFDFLARSMRAGHAFSIGMALLAEESPDPLGVEFRKVASEQALGSQIEVALHNLAERIPLLDVRFFVSSVLLQRETGGNLAEILTKLAYLIRERFRLKGQVRAASAHGRLTAIILSCMPVATMLALLIVAPEYLEILAKDQHGKYMIVGVIAGQLVGYLWMRKIINIKV